MERRSFNDVFNKLSLSGEIKRIFAHAHVDKILINQEEMKISFFLFSDSILPENSLDQLGRELGREFSKFSHIDMSIRYDSDKDIDSILTDSWDNIVYYVSLRSPLCGAILNNSKWESANRRLTIKTMKDVAFVLERKSASKIISHYIKSRFGVDIKVDFKESEKKSSSYKEKIKSIEEDLAERMAGLRESVGTAAGISADRNNGEKPKKRVKSSVKVKKSIQGQPKELNTQFESGDEVIVEGIIFSKEVKVAKSGILIVSFDIYDSTGAITIKMFSSQENYDSMYSPIIEENTLIKIKGKAQYDEYSKEVNIISNEICKLETEGEVRQDLAPVKRVELHLHTQMSAMDAVNSVSDYFKRAAQWGHKAVAITDHGVVQAFPEAMEAAKKHGVKAIYGVEAYLVDDISPIPWERGESLDGEFVIFDLETTGLRKETDCIIEIGAVKIKNGVETQRFSSFVDPHVRLSPEIVELTKITDKMIRGQPDIEEVLPKFLEFCGDAVLVAHNSDFDMGFICRFADQLLGKEVENTVLDTVELSRLLFPELSRHKLDIVAQRLGISLKNHHRAVDDASATAEIFLKFIEMLKEKSIGNLSELNAYAYETMEKEKLKSHHAVILAKNTEGLRHLYELVSKSHIDYFYRRPQIPKSQLQRLREGLIIGSACEAGELYQAVFYRKPKAYIDKLADFYDYFEIQPLGNNEFMVRDKYVASVEDLKEINRKIVALGKKHCKPVAATCDAHFLDAEGEVYRRVIMAGDGFKDADFQAPLYYRTTEEMVREFEYLGLDTAREVVINNTNAIADLIDNIKPIPDGTFPPEIAGSEEELKRLTYERAGEIYGDPLPDIVARRIERELGSIIKNGFAVMYIIAQKLVSKSESEGYLVGSRGSVGSSFVATMSGITEVNPLPPHYICPKCKYSDFDSPEVKEFYDKNPGGSGCDMADKLCPHCNTMLLKEGHDIPFETFLGFDGDKEPDIDLNFSGEYQAKAHAYTEELFGEGHVFKAGTIGTLADKTAYGYVKKYFEEKGISARNAEVNRVKSGLTGIKRTTGQHPGGLIVVPNGRSIYEFCPVQHPANDDKSNIITTHFDYHSISGRLLKLDILGHDVPTIIRMLYDSTGVDPKTVPLGDEGVMSLFTSPKALKVTAEDIECKTGTLGIPEFGTSFVRQMLLDTGPTTFGELVRISGLSHGTDVWFNNAQELIRNKICTLKEVIPTRDDIMVYLISAGVEKLTSFKIMEDVRKGKGLKEEYERIMTESSVPGWYIESCKRIKYMFPKGHAVAYVMMSVRIGYYKVYYPYSFYAATFSVKYEDFDYEIMCKGRESVKEEMKRIKALGNDMSAKDKNTLTTLELVNEMYARGLSFVPIDLYEAQATKFTVTPQGLMPPLCSLQGLGETVAQKIIEEREEGEFLSVGEFRERTKATKTVIELLKNNDLLAGIPDTMQLSLF